MGIIGMVAKEAFEAAAPRIAAVGAEYAGTSAIGRAAGKAATSELGQRVLSRVSPRAATWAAGESGQKWIPRLATREASRTVNNAQSSGTRTVTNVSNPDWDRDTTNTNLASGGNLNQSQMLAARTRPANHGFGGTGKGWWNLNEQTSQTQGVTSDWRTIGDYGVARGPAHGVLPGGSTLRRGVAGAQSMLGSMREGISYGTDGPVRSDGQGRVFPSAPSHPQGDVPQPAAGSTSGDRAHRLENVSTAATPRAPIGAVGSPRSTTPTYAGTSSRTAAFQGGTWPAISSPSKALGRGAIDTHTIEEDSNGQQRWGF